MPTKLRALAALLAILLALYGPPTYRTLRILGIIPQTLPAALVSPTSSISSSGIAYGSASDIITIPNTRHCEDLHHHPRSGLLFTACEGSASPRFHWFPPLAHFERPEDVPRGEGRGGLVVLDPKVFRARWLTLVGFEGPFVTHGIDIIDDPDDPQVIYIHAINHAPALHPASNEPEDLVASRIEVFRHILGSEEATHLRSVRDPLVRTPNDVLALSPGDLLVTNDHKYRAGLLRTVEDLVSHPLGPKTDVVRVSFPLDPDVGGEDVERGVQARVVARGLHNCNGLGHGPSGEEIMLVDAAGGILHLGSLSNTLTAEATLKFDRQVSFPTTIDNPSFYVSSLDPSTKGYLNAGLTAAHTLAHSARDPRGVDPSVIWYLAYNSTDPRVLFADDTGRVLRSASAAVVVDDPEKGERWMFATGFLSEGVVAMRVGL